MRSERLHDDHDGRLAVFGKRACRAIQSIIEACAQVVVATAATAVRRRRRDPLLQPRDKIHIVRERSSMF